MKQYTIEQICRKINGTLEGNPLITITGVEEISQAAQAS
jgi:hypothetical protein